MPVPAGMDANGDIIFTLTVGQTACSWVGKTNTNYVELPGVTCTGVTRIGADGDRVTAAAGGVFAGSRTGEFSVEGPLLFSTTGAPVPLSNMGGTQTAVTAVPAPPPGATTPVLAGGHAVNPQGDLHAVIWQTATGDGADIHFALPGYQLSFVRGLWSDNTSAAFAVGYAELADGATRHALRWRLHPGTGAVQGVDNLNASLPAGVTRSEALAVQGTQSVGSAFTENGEHAYLWNGTTAVSLHPAGAGWSRATAVSGGYITGIVSGQSGTHAVVWRTNGQFLADLHPPAGFTESQALVTNGTLIAGFARDVLSRVRIVMWSTASPNAAHDLSSLPELAGFNGIPTAMDAAGRLVLTSYTQPFKSWLISPDTAPPLVIRTVEMVPGVGIQLTWDACPGRRYQVQFTSNFSTGPWISAGPVTTAIGPVGTFLDGPRGPRGFYRVAEVP